MKVPTGKVMNKTYYPKLKSYTTKVGSLLREEPNCFKYISNLLRPIKVCVFRALKGIGVGALLISGRLV